MRSKWKYIFLILAMTVLFAGCDKESAEQVRIGSLKGPTSMGILEMQNREEYSFMMATGADELLPLIIKKELDIALVPGNVAAVLYQKTEGEVAVIDINTLGVLYLITADTGINSLEDLKDKKIVLTGKGTTPEAVIRYLLEVAGLTQEDYTLDFKAEATEVVNMLLNDSSAIGVLPQPFASAALMQNESLKSVLNLDEVWKEKVSPEGLVTGVTIVRKEFLEEHPKAVSQFLKNHAESVKKINENPEEGAKLVVEAGIVGKEVIASKAIPKCNLVCMVGEEMKKAYAGYLTMLYQFNPALVGGNIPGEDFYYLGE